MATATDSCRWLRLIALLSPAMAGASPAGPGSIPVSSPLAAVPVAAVPTRQIEEIIVTAQKTEQALFEVPISITAVDGEFMRELGARNLQDVAGFIPNVRFSSDTDPALAQLNVRGFGSNPLNGAFESSVGFTQDELFFGRPGYISEAIFDVDRVEVLRGPQGTLFGKNTVAGVFNVYSRPPGDEFGAELRASLADPREQRIEAAVEGPLGRAFKSRLSLLDFDRSAGATNNLQAESPSRFAQAAQRLKLAWEPRADLQLNLTAVQSDTRSAYWPLQLNRLDADTTEFLQRYDPQIEGRIDQRLSYDTPGFLNKGSETVSLKTDWQLGTRQPLDLTLVLGSSSLYVDSLVDLDASPANLAELDVLSDHDQRSAELRLAGRSSGNWFGRDQALDFVAGLYFFDGDYQQRVDIYTGRDFGDYVLTEDAALLASAGGLGAGLSALLGPLSANLPAGGLITTAVGDDRVVLDYWLNTRSAAWFGQATWHLGEHWALTPGLRWTRETKRVNAAGRSECRTALIRACVLGTALGASDYDYRGLRRSESNLSPKLSLQYFSSARLTYFLTAAAGFKSGGFNGSSFSGEDLVYDAEKARTLELGFKSLLRERRLSLNATVFQTRLDQLQVLAFNGAFFDVTNAASAVSRGLELDLHWLTPWSPLSVTGSLGVLDARYRRYPAAPAPIDQGRSSQDLSGRPVALAPRQTLALTPTLNFAPRGWRLRLALDLLYQGEHYSDTDLDPASFIDDNFLLSARASLGSAAGRWALTLAGSNLTDEKLLSQNIDTVFFPGSFNGLQKGERQLSLMLTLRL